MSSPLDYTRFEPPVSEEPWDHEFTVEIFTGHKENKGWDLWGEGMDWKTAEYESGLVKKRGFEVRVTDERGIAWEL